MPSENVCIVLISSLPSKNSRTGERFSAMCIYCYFMIYDINSSAYPRHSTIHSQILVNTHNRHHIHSKYIRIDYERRFVHSFNVNSLMLTSTWKFIYWHEVQWFLLFKVNTKDAFILSPSSLILTFYCYGNCRN